MFHQLCKDLSNPLCPSIILVQLFELSSAVGSVFQINKTGKYGFSSVGLSGQKPLCEMGISNFCQKYETFNAPNSIIDLCDITLIYIKFGAFTIIGVIVPKDCTYPEDYYFTPVFFMEQRP